MRERERERFITSKFWNNAIFTKDVVNYFVKTPSIISCLHTLQGFTGIATDIHVRNFFLKIFKSEQVLSSKGSEFHSCAPR